MNKEKIIYPSIKISLKVSKIHLIKSIEELKLIYYPYYTIVIIYAWQVVSVNWNINHRLALPEN